MIPKVSIGIPTYNGGRFLEAAIESALNQSYEDIEVFVCDNRSSDNTGAICSGVKDPRFRCRAFEEHVGQAGSWNRCLRESRGDFVVLLHADDILVPTFVSRALKALEEAPGAAFVHAAVRHVTADGQFLFLQRLHETDQETAGKDFFLRLMREGCIVNPAGVMVRRLKYEETGPFYESVNWGTDWDMWLRLCLSGSVVSLAEPLASYREHGFSGTAAVVASGENGQDELRVIDHVLALVPPEMGDVAALRREGVSRAAHRTWCWAEEACRAGHSSAARRGVVKSVLMDSSLLWKGHVWALLVASFFGYVFFQKVQRVRGMFRGHLALRDH